MSEQVRRIAITGVGMVTPVGNDAPTTWKNLQAGKSGAGITRGFDASGFISQISAEVKNFDSSGIEICGKLRKYASKAHLFALSAAAEALSDAGIFPEDETRKRWGLSVGAGMASVAYHELEATQRYTAADGDFDTEGLLNPEFAKDPIAFCRWQPNTGLGLLARQFGIQGYATSVHTACASGGQAIGTALKVMRRGECDFMLAGGYDSMISPVGISGFCLLGALSTDNDSPETASRPFDLTRNGFVLGEGSGFLVLEEWEAARERGAHIYAELAGDGNSLSAYRITDSPPDGDGPIQAIERALQDAGISIEDVDYVNAHGTSTQMNDKSECVALKKVMGEHGKKVHVSSTKSCMGHLISAAGAVEGAVCALAIRDGVAPVSANLKKPDPDCDVNIVTGESREVPIRAALSNSLGFGGSNSSLVFRSPKVIEASL